MAKKKTKQCKILFNILVQRMWKIEENDEIKDLPLYTIDTLISYIMKLGKKKRFYDLKDNKFCFLENANIEYSENQPLVITGVFKSARNEFRPDLINKKTGTERKNPKELSEGDIEKTHFIIKINKTAEEVYFFLEYNYYGIGMTTIINYLSYFNKEYLFVNKLKRNYSIKHLLIARDSFINELKNLNRIRIAEIYFDKKLLGGRALNFSDRTISLRKDLKLVATASAGESIKEVGIDFYNALQTDSVSKVRIYGNDEQNNEVVLDTTFAMKYEHVTVDIYPDTGEVNSAQLYTGLRKVTEKF
jgi:hypothetical protein